MVKGLGQCFDYGPGDVVAIETQGARELAYQSERVNTTWKFKSYTYIPTKDPALKPLGLCSCMS